MLDSAFIFSAFYSRLTPLLHFALVASLPVHPSKVWDVSGNGGGKGSNGNGNGNHHNLVDADGCVNAAVAVTALAGHHGEVMALVADAGAALVLSGSSDHTVKVGARVVPCAVRRLDSLADSPCFYPSSTCSRLTPLFVLASPTLTSLYLFSL